MNATRLMISTVQQGQPLLDFTTDGKTRIFRGYTVIIRIL